jgi:hypothetical protein
MNRRALGLATVTALVLVASGSGIAPPAAQTPPAPATPRPLIAPREPDPGPALPPMTYEAKARRDPFAPVVIASGSKGLTIGSAKLVGIISGPQPLALVETPEGIGYILKAGDTLGDGRVTEIAADSVSFAVSPKPGEKSGIVTLRLRTD